MDVLWQALATIITALFTKPENIGLLISLTANVALSYFIVITRREDRVDRKAMTDAMVGMTKAINEVRLVIAAALGKVG